MKQRYGVEEESCFWFRRVTTADVTIYLSSDNYYCRRYIEATRSSTSYPPPLFLPRLTSSSVVSFFFFFSFLFSTSSLANSVNNESPRSMVQQLRCFSFLRRILQAARHFAANITLRSEIIPFQRKYTMSRGKVSNRWSWKGGGKRGGDWTVLIVKCDEVNSRRARPLKYLLLQIYFNYVC